MLGEDLKVAAGNGAGSGMRAPFKKAAAVGDREGGYAESYGARGGGPGPGSATEGLCRQMKLSF